MHVFALVKYVIDYLVVQLYKCVHLYVSFYSIPIFVLGSSFGKEHILLQLMVQCNHAKKLKYM